MRCAQFADELLALGQEESMLRTAALVGLRADELDFGFRQDSFSVV